MAQIKIFQIGFNKCGTRSISDFFKKSGYLSHHWKGGRLARNIDASKRKGFRPLGRWSDAVLFADLECVENGDVIESYKDFAFLDRHYPDAHFILNKRPVDDWLRSRIFHKDGTYFKKYMAHYGTRNPIDVLDRWAQDWADHFDAVRSYFADRPGKLVECDIVNDGAEPLIEHFKDHLDLDPKAWPHLGKSVASS